MTWNQFVSVMFQDCRAMGVQPWKQRGVHHMTWVSEQYTKIQQWVQGVGDPTDFSDVETATPESLLLEMEAA